MRRVAVLHHGSQRSPMVARLLEGLRSGGHIQGRTCVFDVVGVDGDLARLEATAAALVAWRPDVMSVIGAVAALAAKRATSRIPVVHATVLDPRDVGLAADNLVAVTTFDPKHAGRQVRLLQQLRPGLATIACLTDPKAPVASDGVNPLASALCKAAGCAGLQVHRVPLHGDPAEIPDAFASLVDAGATAVVALEVPAVLSVLVEIVEEAERRRLPTLVPSGRAARGIASLGPGLIDAAEPLAHRIIAILDGASPSAMATQRVRNDRLEIDLGVARRIGVEVPRAVLRQATRIVADEDSESAGARKPRTGPGGERPDT